MQKMKVVFFESQIVRLIEELHAEQEEKAGLIAQIAYESVFFLWERERKRD